MNISFKNLSRLSLRKKKKDTGISLARATRTWIVLLCGMFLLLCVGAVFGVYMFYMATDTARDVSADPVDTVRYQSADIDAALLRYDALRERFSVPAIPATSTPPTAAVLQPSSTSTVATSTPVRVE